MRVIVVTLFGLGIAIAGGCSMCAPGFLDDYATVGGKWQRSDPTGGRVGSIFSDPGTTIAGQTEQLSAGDYYEGELGGEIYSEEIHPGNSYESGDEFFEMDDEIYEGAMDDTSHYDDGVIVLGDQW